ncbi:MAG: hypothetical protein ABW104_18180 [Candidatus Thiodiazotropha sp. 6PLUC2]
MKTVRRIKTRLLATAITMALGGSFTVLSITPTTAFSSQDECQEQCSEEESQAEEKDNSKTSESRSKLKWKAGDFHQHSYYTDGSYRFEDVMEKNSNYLDWWANSEHGGERNRDGNGEYWDDVNIYPENPILGDVEYSGEHQEMWRWQSLRDYVFSDIQETRVKYPKKIVINGLEWNVPSHEHCSTAIHQYGKEATAISEFEYRFDKSDDDTSRNGEVSILASYGPLEKTNETAEDAVAGVTFMQALKKAGIADAWVIPAHIERANSYTIADFRNWNNAGPDVAFGFEGAPGHQTSGSRGFGTSSDGGGTYGGVGWYTATLGGLWDAMLGEGRHWWNFASSDFHNHWSTGGSDFWPGEYQKIYTYMNTKSNIPEEAVFDSLRSGASWHVEGDLIDKLNFTASAKDSRNVRNKVIMGQTIEAKRGSTVTLKIKLRDPVGTNNCPLDMENPSLAQVGISQPLNMPELDHIDIIGGEVTGYVDPSDPDYSKETNESTAVVATFEREDGLKSNGNMTFVYKFKADKDMYFRLRGTNLPADVPFETDAEGNPLADSEAEDNLYNMSGEELSSYMFKDILDHVIESKIDRATTSKLDEVAEAYADLWFYSNPIFIHVK